MTLKLYNTMSSKIELFKPRVKNKVTLYVCGPTVYDYSHIGHGKTYMAFDLITRYLEYKGYNVKYVVNITDIDDKIIKRANESGMDSIELAKKFEKLFLDDMHALGIKDADIYPKVSGHIPEIIAIIQTLINKGFAYVVDGDVYFTVSKVEDYGKLSNQTLDAIKSGARVVVDKRKKNPADFALWKNSKKGEPSWSSPWSKGRPGWHIECSAMSTKYLGQQIDIHGGGRDLIFPHHENELAQSEAYSGKKPFASYWLHTGFLTINGEKMSKSLGNFITIVDLLDKWDAEVFRLFILSTHYRKPVNFTQKTLEHQKQSLRRIYNTVDNLKLQIQNTQELETVDKLEEELQKQISHTKDAIINAMDDDFKTPKALSEFHNLVKIGNKAIAAKMSKSTLTKVLNTIMEIAHVFGLLEKKRKVEALPEEIQMLLKEREMSRNQKNWKKADEIRLKLKSMGIIVEDKPEGTQWRYQN
jgi:cysteinyl-tRNA synthetase